MNLTPHINKRGWTALGLLILIISMIQSPLLAETIELNPDQDNTLYERVAGDLSNGTGSSLFFGQTGQNANFALRRALLRFDLSSIPPGSTIEDTSLTITVDLVPPTATGFDAPLHRVESPWGEGTSFAPGAGGGGAAAAAGDATWIHTFFDDQFWNTPGGDFAEQASSFVMLNNGNGEFSFEITPELLADLQTWVNQPSQNFGWILLGEEANPQNARRIGSRENTSTPPVLTVQFERGPELPEARPVPVLSDWGMLVMLLLMSALAWFGIKGRFS